MTEQTSYVDVGEGKIRDLDADEYGNFIAFTDNRKIITNDHNLKIDIDIHFPIIRRLDNEKFLIADSRTEKLSNGHIYNFYGQLILSFLIGDGIEDIVILDDKIIATYFDEGVYGEDGPNNEGVSVFDFSGKQLFGLNSRAIWGHIDDCYCICKHGTNRVLFYAYTDFNVYELNLETLNVEVYETPDDFSGASAISGKENKIYFHSSYHDKQSFFLWDRNKNEVTKFGSYGSQLKGIGNGKFLAFGDKGYTIFDPSE